MNNYDIEKMVENAKKGNASEILKSLNQADSKKIKEILQDKEQTSKLLNSQEAQKILEMLKRGGMLGG